MTVFYKTRQGGRDIDLDDLYVRRSLFQIGNYWAWGTNNVGQIGNNTTTNYSSPVQVVGSGTNWKQVTSCYYNGTGIKGDGTLWTWGTGVFGQLGNNDSAGTSQSSPVQTVTASNEWYSVDGGFYYNAAIKTDGSLWLWGNNGNGQLGDNSTTLKSSPVQTVTASRDWSVVSAGQATAGAIKTDGTLWMWGAGSSGILGNNASTDRSSPVQTVAGGNNWSQVAVGHTATGAIKTDGTLWTWGSNIDGGLGDNSTTSRSSPVQTVAGGTNWKVLATGMLNSAMAAIKIDGTLWLWGSNVNGMLGNNNRTSRSSPVQTVSAGNNWRSVSVGEYHTGAIKTDGTLWMWGDNSSGQLGPGFTASRSSPIQTVAGGSNWVSIECNGSNSFALNLS